MVVTIKQKTKRKAGQRAGMSRTKIAVEATKLWLHVGPEGFTIRLLAKQLKVGPTTIHAHFKGGIRDLRREIARQALTELTPPYQPKQTPKQYLRAFLRSALSSFRQNPGLGRLVVFELTDDPLLSLVFAERLGATIAGLAIDVDVIWGLELLIGRLAGLFMIETGIFARANPKAANSALQVRLLGVSSTEFPTLKQDPATLGAALIKRAEPGYLTQKADAAAMAFVSDLSKDGQ
jgi:TetR/AcrR family transcriptional regulator, tetracycline repressor protein